MEDNKTIAFDSGNFYIEKLYTIRTEGQKIVRGISNVLGNCYALYYEYAENVKGGEEDFKAFLTKKCQRKEIGVNTYDNDGTIPRLIVHFVFEGLDRRTGSKYGQVLEDAYKSQPITKPNEFEAWYKARGGLNPKDKEGVMSFEQQSDYNEFVLDYFKKHVLQAFTDTPADTEIPLIALFKVRDGKLMSSERWFFHYSDYEEDGKTRKVFDTFLRTIMKNGTLGDAQIGKLYEEFSEAKIKAEQKEVA